MAINTAAKRKSSMASRCLPWQRRFTPIPDGSMSQEDRQQNRWIYRGILAATPVPVVPPSPAVVTGSDSAVWPLPSG